MIWVTAVSLIRLRLLPLLMVMEAWVKFVCPICTSVLLPPPALPPQATTSTITTMTTTAPIALFMACSSPLEQGLVLSQASPCCLSHCLTTKAALLNRQRPHHVALGCHRPLEAVLAGATGIKALEDVGSSFADEPG